jgi:hypothetical protein
VPLRDPNGFVAKQNRYLLDRNFSEEQFDRERVPKLMEMTTLPKIGFLEDRLVSTMPIRIG